MTAPLDYLKKMAEHGINFFVQMPTGGCIDLDVDEVAIFMADENAYWARKYGVSVAAFVEWQRWAETQGGIQCSATTAKKKRCANFVPAPESPVYYTQGQSVLCDVHKPKGE